MRLEPHSKPRGASSSRRAPKPIFKPGETSAIGLRRNTAVSIGASGCSPIGGLDAASKWDNWFAGHRRKMAIPDRSCEIQLVRAIHIMPSPKVEFGLQSCARLDIVAVEGYFAPQHGASISFASINFKTQVAHRLLDSRDRYFDGWMAGRNCLGQLSRD
jgi:hypothetical protein